MEPIKLKSIEEEAEDCRKAFEKIEAGTLVEFCHHEVPIECLYEAPEARISFILEHKEPHEQALRLRMFRPATPTDVGQLDYGTSLAMKLDGRRAKELYKVYQEAKQKYEEETEPGVETELYKALDTARDDFYNNCYITSALNKAAKADYIPYLSRKYEVEWKGDIFETFETE